MRSIAYCRIRLVNKKTAGIANITPHVGINSKQEAGEYVRYPFLVILLGCVVLRLRVLRYPKTKHLELYTGVGISVGIGWYFVGIIPTNTNGKLGW